MLVALQGQFIIIVGRTLIRRGVRRHSQGKRGVGEVYFSKKCLPVLLLVEINVRVNLTFFPPRACRVRFTKYFYLGIFNQQREILPVRTPNMMIVNCFIRTGQTT